jgi:transcriptional regulator of acetoin/glycerol metabolism
MWPLVGDLLELTDIVYTSGLGSKGGPMTERELARGAARRLAMIRHAQEVSGSVAKTCRYYGVSRPTYYKWLRRYEAQASRGSGSD